MSSRRFRGPTTPLPSRKITVLCLILFVNECNTWLLYSYLPFLVHFLLPEVSTPSLGYWSALLGFAYYFGALLGNLGWGLAADRVGRRPVLLGGVLGSGVLSCLFGFSRRYWLSVALRFVWGLLNTTGVSRTAVMEVLDDSNSAQGMVLYSVVSGLGRLVGPLVGGLAARPAVHFHLFRHSVFEAFPFALPALLSLFWASLIGLLAFLELEETLPSHRIEGLSSYCCCCFFGRISSDASTYSILGSSATEEEDNELDVSMSPDRSKARGVRGSYTDGIELKPQRSVISSNSSIRRDMDADADQHLRDDDYGGLEEDQEDGQSCGGRRREKKKGVTFNSYVQMKVIDTSEIRYKQLKRITAEDTPQFYSAEERDNNYNRSGSYVAAQEEGAGRGGQGGGGQRGIEGEDDQQDMDVDMDTSSRALVDMDMESSSGDQIEKYTNGSELIEMQETTKDFRQLSVCGLLRVLARSKLVYFTSLTYFLLVAASTALNEVVPLWLVVPAADGGFGFNGSMLSLALFCSGPISLGMQLCAFPSAAHNYGLLPLIRTCLAVFSLIAVLTPALGLHLLHQASAVLAAALIVISYTALTVAADWALVIIYVFINNACYSYQRATVNGFTQAVACLAMMLASLGGSSFFALCESNSLKHQLPWPFRYAVVFWAIALFANTARQTTYRLHRKIQKVRREPRFPRYAVQMEHFSMESTGANNSNDDDDDGDNYA